MFMTLDTIRNLSPDTKIGLALGGGAALGWAHIGALRVLQEKGVRIDVLAGTSIGSIVGACYASDKLDILEKIARDMNWRKMIALADVQIGKSGFLAGEPVVKLLGEHFDGLVIEDLNIPFGAVAADLVSGEEVVFRSGDVVSAIRPSISLPGVFTPVRTGDQLLVDGGLLNTVPVSVCHDMGADYVIGVNVVGDYQGQAGAAGILSIGQETPDGIDSGKTELTIADASAWQKAASALRENVSGFFKRKNRDPSFLGVALTSSAMILRQISESQQALCPADLFVVPKIGHITQIEFDRADELIELGRKAMETALQIEQSENVISYFDNSGILEE